MALQHVIGSSRVTLERFELVKKKLEPPVQVVYDRDEEIAHNLPPATWTMSTPANEEGCVSVTVPLWSPSPHAYQYNSASYANRRAYSPTQPEERPPDPFVQERRAAEKRDEESAWLADGRLIGKRVDIIIQGTVSTNFHKGKYEGRRGFFIVDAPLLTPTSHVAVKLGVLHATRNFQRRHIAPEKTTAREGTFEPSTSMSVLAKTGTPIVIISPAGSQRVGQRGDVISGDGTTGLISVAGEEVGVHIDHVCRSSNGHLY